MCIRNATPSTARFKGVSQATEALHDSSMMIVAHPPPFSPCTTCLFETQRDPNFENLSLGDTIGCEWAADWSVRGEPESWLLPPPALSPLDTAPVPPPGSGPCRCRCCCPSRRWQPRTRPQTRACDWRDLEEKGVFAHRDMGFRVPWGYAERYAEQGYTNPCLPQVCDWQDLEKVFACAH